QQGKGERGAAGDADHVLQLGETGGEITVPSADSRQVYQAAWTGSLFGRRHRAAHVAFLAVEIGLELFRPRLGQRRLAAGHDHRVDAAALGALCLEGALAVAEAD